MPAGHVCQGQAHIAENTDCCPKSGWGDMVEHRLRESSAKLAFFLFPTPDTLLQLAPPPWLTSLGAKLHLTVKVLAGCERPTHTSVIRVMVCPSLTSVPRPIQNKDHSNDSSRGSTTLVELALGELSGECQSWTLPCVVQKRNTVSVTVADTVTVTVADTVADTVTVTPWHRCPTGTRRQ